MTLTIEGRVKLDTRIYPLDAVNDAMDDLEHGKLHGRGISSRGHRLNQCSPSALMRQIGRVEEG